MAAKTRLLGGNDDLMARKLNTCLSVTKPLFALWFLLLTTISEGTLLKYSSCVSEGVLFMD